MRIGFVVNDVQTEQAAFTTTRLAMAAVNMGHESFILGVGDFIYAPDGSIHANAHTATQSSYKSLETFIQEVQRTDSRKQTIGMDELDVLMLRNDPAEDAVERPWAQTCAILFASMAAAKGVLVLNDPENLSRALNKTYFQQFPERVRPKTYIGRDIEGIKEYIIEQKSKVVIKPLQGSGGSNVFVVGKSERANLTQMLEAITRFGYCIVQEYLPAAVEGDVRFFVMNGKPLEYKGNYAAFRRINTTGDARSNMHSGGESAKVDVTEEMLELVDLVGPKLKMDGMFLVGLDIIKDKLIEINVFSPGGLGSSQKHTKVDFTEIVIQDIERKVRTKKLYNGFIKNSDLATL